MFFIREKIGNVEGRCFIDSAPILERAWAKKSGLGWVGKNTNIINKERGSFFFISQLIIDLDLIYDGAVADHCGSCNKCIDACPTGAIIEPYVVDGSQCISYFTIELKDNIPNEMRDRFDNWMFGCDVCQQVCPWNIKFSQKTSDENFKMKSNMKNMTDENWSMISKSDFNSIFKKSAVKRTKFDGLKRNIKANNKSL